MLRQENEAALRKALRCFSEAHESSTQQFLSQLFKRLDEVALETATARVIELMLAPSLDALQASAANVADESFEVAKSAKAFKSALSTLISMNAGSAQAPITAVEKEIFSSQVQSAFRQTLLKPLLEELKQSIRALFTEDFSKRMASTTNRDVPRIVNSILNAEAIAMAERDRDRVSFLYDVERQNVRTAYRSGFYDGRRQGQNERSIWAVDQPQSDDMMNALVVNFLDLPSVDRATPTQKDDGGFEVSAERQTGASFRKLNNSTAPTKRGDASKGNLTVLDAASNIAGALSRPMSFRRSNSAVGGSKSEFNYDVPAAIRREEALWRATDQLHELLKRRCLEEEECRQAAVRAAVAEKTAFISKLDEEGHRLRANLEKTDASLQQMKMINAMLIDQLEASRSHGHRLSAELAFYQRELSAVGGYRRQTTSVDAAVRALEIPDELSTEATERCLAAAKGAMLNEDSKELFERAKPLLRFELPSKATMAQQTAILQQATEVRDVEDENQRLRVRIRQLEEDLAATRRRVLEETDALRSSERQRFEKLNSQFVAAKKRCMLTENLLLEQGTELRKMQQQLADTMRSPRGCGQVAASASPEMDSLRRQLADRERELQLLRNLLGKREESPVRKKEFNADEDETLSCPTTTNGHCEAKGDQGSVPPIPIEAPLHAHDLHKKGSVARWIQLDITRKNVKRLSGLSGEAIAETSHESNPRAVAMRLGDAFANVDGKPTTHLPQHIAPTPPPTPRHYNDTISFHNRVPNALRSTLSAHPLLQPRDHMRQLHAALRSGVAKRPASANERRGQFAQ